jgi:hypothetical protein
LILYVNGDSHSAGAEAVNSYCFAEDDPNLRLSGRKSHPNNLAVSYGQRLADRLGYDLVCQAESASSNDRILRTTREYLKTNRPDLIIIGWSTWEREEWVDNDRYWQISASMGDDWPDSIKHRYRDWIHNIDYRKKEQEEHDKIWQLHLELANIPHLFFNSYLAFKFTNKRDWGTSYIGPYEENQTYYHWLSNQGYKTVNPSSYHYGASAHQLWANHLTFILKESIMFT